MLNESEPILLRGLVKSFHQYSHPHEQETREKMSVSQLDLWVREAMKGRREGREGGREGGGAGDVSGCGPVCIPQTGLQSTLREPLHRDC